MSETLSSIFRPTRNGGVSTSTSSPTHVTEVEDDAYVSADADDNKSGELTPLSPIISPRAFNQKTNPTSIITIEGVVTSSTLPTIIQKSFTKRLIQILLTLTCLLGYGISLYVNGLSGRTLTPATGLVLLGSVRGITLLILSTILYITNSVPVGYQRYSNEPPATVRWQLLVPAFVAIYANSGFLPYAELIKGGQVSVLAPMCALYSLVPISIGLLVFKESRGILKLTGIALSLTSVLLLAFSGSGFAGTSATASEIGIKILLLFSVVALWGGGDAMAAYLGRSLSSFEIAISNSAGQFATAAIFGLIAIVSGESFSNDGGNISFILSSVAANILGIIAWMSFTKLGETEGASDFTPIVALYVFIPVLLSSIFLHESLIDSPLKLTGLILGGVASILLGLK
jgi:drug/metabolite transporter (DMT)-like permease